MRLRKPKARLHGLAFFIGRRIVLPDDYGSAHCSISMTPVAVGDRARRAAVHSGAVAFGQCHVEILDEKGPAIGIVFDHF